MKHEARRIVAESQDTVTFATALVLHCTSSSEYDNADCDVAVIELSKGMIAEITRRGAMFRSLEAQDAGVCNVQFSDCTADFYRISGELAQVFDSELFGEQSWAVATELRLSASACQPVHTRWMDVTANGVSWCGFPNGADFQVSTVELPIAELNNFGNRLQPVDDQRESTPRTDVTMHQLRISAANAALQAYCTAKGGDPTEYETLVDVLADLRHLSAELAIDFEQAVETSEIHFETERAEELVPGAGRSNADE